MTKLKGPKFVQYFQPVIDALRDLGSSTKPREVYTWVAERHTVPKEEIEGTTKGGQSKFENKVGRLGARCLAAILKLCQNMLLGPI